MNDALFSSATEVWATPQALFDRLDDEFHFEVDVCAVPENAKCADFFTPDDDGLSQDWSRFGATWMNPPYGREIGKWMEKALLESEKGAIVVCLVPARTDTSWWWESARYASEIRLIRGRLKFGDAKSGAPFPSAIVIFQKHGVDRDANIYFWDAGVSK